MLSAGNLFPSGFLYSFSFVMFDILIRLLINNRVEDVIYS